VTWPSENGAGGSLAGAADELAGGSLAALQKAGGGARYGVRVGGQGW
jgi:hypothetical protein